MYHLSRWFPGSLRKYRQGAPFLRLSVSVVCHSLCLSVSVSPSVCVCVCLCVSRARVLSLIKSLSCLDIDPVCCVGVTNQSLTDSFLVVSSVNDLEQLLFRAFLMYLSIYPVLLFLDYKISLILEDVPVATSVLTRQCKSRRYASRLVYD